MFMKGNDVKNRPKLLIVDDVPENIQILIETLKDEYLIVVAINGERALKLAAMPPQPDIILLDVMMPGMDGFEVCRRLKADDRTNSIPILFVTALNENVNEAKGLEIGAVDYISKPFNPFLVEARIHNHLELKRHRDHLEEVVRLRTDELSMTRDVAIESLGALVEYRDPETGGHILRTQGSVRLLAHHLKNHPKFRQALLPGQLERIVKCAPLHDVGKVGVPDAVLLKPGKLTMEEFEIIKQHTIIGHDALQKAEQKMGTSSFFGCAREIAYTHHEKWDGSGYPQGLQGEAIPVSGRLMALADVYDALISKRVYKPSMSHAAAVEIIQSERGRHFDPDVTDAFLANQEEFQLVALEHADAPGDGTHSTYHLPDADK